MASNPKTTLEIANPYPKMASLQQLLAEEGFKRSSRRRKQKQGSFRNRVEDDPVFNFKPPTYICHDQRSVKPSEYHESRTRKASIDTTGAGRDPAMDQIAMKEIVSTLSGYIGRYTTEAAFQQRIRERCNSCLVGKSNDTILRNMDLAVQMNGEEKEVSPPADNGDGGNFVVSKMRSSSESRTTQDYSYSEISGAAASDGLQKPEDYLKFLSCKSLVAECVAAADANLLLKNNLSSRRNSLDNSHLSLRRSIVEICTSDVLSDCEAAIHEITKTWLSTGGDPVIEDALSKQPVIESMVEILYASQDDEILELVISLLAELASRKDRNRVAILNYDPQLDIFIKLLKSSSLFLKAATLLYQLKPLAKQMISTEWVALALRVLEFGDQLQVLFNVMCSPHEAGIYFLEQLMMGFDEDKNLENSCEVVSLGGLSLLVRRFEIGGVKERNEIAMLVCSCVKAVESCRDYLAENLSKRFLLQLIALGIRTKQGKAGFALKLLTELLCLSRRRQIIKLLVEINHGFDAGLNAMHIFLAYLQRASAEERPLVAAILLQLDLLEGDPMKHSVYREEAIEALIECLDCERCDSEAQEQTARALLMMGGSFSHEEEATTTTEEWLFQGRLDESIDGSNLNEEEEATMEWQRKLAIVLLNSGGQRFLTALSGAIANGIPNLARTSLFTVSWMNQMSLHSFDNRKLIPLTHSVLLSQLTDERSPSSLQNLVVQNHECASMLWTLDPLRTHHSTFQEQELMTKKILVPSLRHT